MRMGFGAISPVSVLYQQNAIGAKGKRKTGAPRTLQSIVDTVNANSVTKNFQQKNLQTSIVQTGLKQIEKEAGEDKKSPLESYLVDVAGKMQKEAYRRVNEQYQRLGELLQNVKPCVDVIAKYEALASDETKSEEEHKFYQDALVSLKDYLQEEIDLRVGRISFSTLGGCYAKDLLKEYGITDFQTLDSKQLSDRIDSLSQDLEKSGFKSEHSSKNGMMGCFGLFEESGTQAVKNYDKYGYRLTWENQPKNPKLYGEGTVFYFSELKKGRLLDAQG